MSTSTSSAQEAESFVIGATFIGAGLGFAFLIGGLVGRFDGNIGECLGSALLGGLAMAMFWSWVASLLIDRSRERTEVRNKDKG